MNTAELLADIGEIEARSLHLKAGYKSLHAFCMAEYGSPTTRRCCGSMSPALRASSPQYFMRSPTVK